MKVSLFAAFCYMLFVDIYCFIGCNLRPLPHSFQKNAFFSKHVSHYDTCCTELCTRNKK